MSFTKKLFNTSLLLGGTLGAMAIYNRITESLAGELDSVLTGKEYRYPWKYGDMFYEVKGAREAKPLLLIHSFGPGASSYEWRKNVDVLAEHFHVYTLDLLGYGSSDHPVIDYDAELYTDLLYDFIREVIGDQRVIAVAHGMTCAYIIACAFRRPQLFERLVLISPPQDILYEAQETSFNLVSAAFKAILRLPVIGQFIYNLLTSRRAIRSYYDKYGYHNLGLLTDELVEYIFTSAHQPNSHYAIASYLGDALTLDVREPLARLKVPALIVWGRESTLTPTEQAETFKQINPNLETRILDKSRFHLQDEQATSFNNLLREYANAPVS
ncbi:MAG TPA: alpha/beta fold hydrolase [Ktedonobacteraceae bacterium]